MTFSARFVPALALAVFLFLTFWARPSTGGNAVEIIANPKTGRGPMLVHMEPRVNGLKGPLRFRWYFGDGQESTSMIPKPHFYEFGKYDLLLEVTDMEGKEYTASVGIDAALPG